MSDLRRHIANPDTVNPFGARTYCERPTRSARTDVDAPLCEICVANRRDERRRG